MYTPQAQQGLCLVVQSINRKHETGKMHAKTTINEDNMNHNPRAQLLQEQSQDDEKSLLRGFTHIVIPAEIWLRRDMSMSAKALWAELRSLHSKEHGGCYASPEYLCEFLGVNRRRFYQLQAELKELGLLEVIGFDGRKVVRRAIVPPVDYGVDLPKESGDIEVEESENEPTTNAQQQCNIVHSSSAINCTPAVQFTALPTYIDSKGDRKVDTPPNPQRGKVCVDVSSSSKNGVKQPKTADAGKVLHLDHILLTPEEHAKLLAIHGEQALTWMLELLNAAIGSKGYEYKSHYAVMSRGGWVCKRLEEEKAKRPNLCQPGTYQRSGKHAIAADKEMQGKFKIQEMDSTIRPEEQEEFEAFKEALKRANPKNKVQK